MFAARSLGTKTDCGIRPEDGSAVCRCTPAAGPRPQPVRAGKGRGEAAPTWRRRTGRRPDALARRFGHGEEGSLSIFALFMFFMIMLWAGVGVDLMLNELDRTKLQATLDRAVLAAADLDQELPPADVVRDYFAKSGLSGKITGITVDEGLNYRTVSARAATQTVTLLTHLAGKPTLPALARGTAEERIGKVEISLVLDISGSMRWNNKIGNLRTAAKEFLDIVLNPANDGLVSVNVVPYTAQVNAGPKIFDKLKVNQQKHDYSHCLEFLDYEFSRTDINLKRNWKQGQHFMWSSSYSNPISNPECPKRSYERISPLSGDLAGLKNQVGKFQPRANTSIHLGMKWGVALLDPSARPLVDQMIAAGEVDPVFSGRPADYSDRQTLKTVVLMTDGQNVDTYRITNPYYNSANDVELWNMYPLWYYLYRYVSWRDWHKYYYRKYSAAQADGLLDNICTAAKDAGIIVWTIGFETGSHGSAVMKKCASSPSHFFEVKGNELVDAFTAIAHQINQLRLTQ